MAWLLLAKTALSCGSTHKLPMKAISVYLSSTLSANYISACFSVLSRMSLSVAMKSLVFSVLSIVLNLPVP